MSGIGRRAVIAAPFVLLLAGCTPEAARPVRTADASGGGPTTVRLAPGGSARATPPASASPAPPADATPTPTSTPAFDKTANSTTDPHSLWVVVNKKHALTPVDYAPTDLVYPPAPNINGQPLRKPAADALAAMFAAGKSEQGLSFSIQSGYRSYSVQVAVYNQSVASNGQAVADNLTARPGTSEHQTGLAVDISAVPAQYSLQEAFSTTPHAKWLAANAWRFGFLLRYPSDKVAVTGYSFEPWHFRYLGVPLATELHNTHVETLEEFFGIPGGVNY
ncbi:MAG TPA: M15 family metallopeptidase [Gryllotalpicola sp.]